VELFNGSIGRQFRAEMEREQIRINRERVNKGETSRWKRGGKRTPYQINEAQSSSGTSHKGDERKPHLTMRITTCIIHPVGWRKECMYRKDDDRPIDLACEPSVRSRS